MTSPLTRHGTAQHKAHVKGSDRRKREIAIGEERPNFSTSELRFLVQPIKSERPAWLSGELERRCFGEIEHLKTMAYGSRVASGVVTVCAWLVVSVLLLHWGTLQKIIEKKVDCRLCGSIASCPMTRCIPSNCFQGCKSCYSRSMIVRCLDVGAFCRPKPI